MKKLFPLLLLNILFVSTPIAQTLFFTETEAQTRSTNQGPVTGDGLGGPVTGDGLSANKAKVCAQIREQNGGLDQELKNSIVPCGRSAHQCDTDTSNDQCEFKHLFILVNNLVNSFILVVFAPLLTLVLTYIGFLFIKEKAAAKAKAKALLWQVLVGTFFVLASWLVVNLLLTALGADTVFTNFFRNN